MTSSVLAVGLALTTLVAASLSPSPKRAQVGSGTLRSSVTTHKAGVIPGWGRKLKSKRQDADAAPLTNQENGTAYTIDIDVGTPSQKITVILDTGSNNLWVNPQCDASGQQDYCETFPQFDYTQSSTIEDTGYADTLAYGKGQVVVEYVTDVVGIGSASITEQTFGIGSQSSNIPLGILGLSPPIDDNEEYSYVLDSMVSQGLIASRAFSLDLRDVDSPDGSVIFGGVDTGKFVGELEKCPILDPIETPSGNDRYWIDLTSLGMTLPDGSSGLLVDDTVPVFLDSGGTMTRLPTAVFESIGAAFADSAGAQYDQGSGYFVVDCSLMSMSGSVDFGFNDKVISVDFENFIWAVPDACVLAVMADDDEPVLGDSFLRAAYVVYDQDNRNLHLAQAANCGSNLVAISSGEDAVPSVTGDCTAGAQASVASASLTVASTAPTLTDGPSLTSVAGGAPGPGGTATRVKSSLCLSCTPTTTAAHAAATATRTGSAQAGAPALRREGSQLAAFGAVALAAWLI